MLLLVEEAPKSRKKSLVFRSKQTRKSLKRTQKSSSELKFQKVYVCNFQMFSLGAKWGKKSKIDAVRCIKDARCSGLTATINLKHHINHIINGIAMLE